MSAEESSKVSMVDRATEVLHLHDTFGTGLPNGNIYTIGHEYAEFMEARDNGTDKEVHREYGDLLMSVLLTGLQMGLDPEQCLEACVTKMTTRITYVGQHITVSEGNPVFPRECTRLWEEAKSLE